MARYSQQSQQFSSCCLKRSLVSSRCVPRVRMQFIICDLWQRMNVLGPQNNRQKRGEGYKYSNRPRMGRLVDPREPFGDSGELECKDHSEEYDPVIITRTKSHQARVSSVQRCEESLWHSLAHQWSKWLLKYHSQRAPHPPTGHGTAELTPHIAASDGNTQPTAASKAVCGAGASNSAKSRTPPWLQRNMESKPQEI